MKYATITLSLLCWIASAAATDEYRISLSRPNKAGDTFHMSCEGYELNKIVATINGEVADNVSEKTGIEFDGNIQVINVDSNKTPSSLNITIGKLIKIQDVSKTAFIRDEVKTPLLIKGTVVTASVVKYKDVFFIDKMPVDDDIQKMLSMVIELGKNRPTDDEVFGSQVPRKVGDTWEINKQKTLEGILDRGELFDKNDIEGTATLKDILMVNGKKCLNVNALIRINNINPPMSPGIVVKKATFKANYSGIFPVDASTDRLEEREEMTTYIMAENAPKPDSRAMTIETTIKQVITTKYSYGR